MDAVPGKIIAAVAAALAGYLEAEASQGRAFRIVDVRRGGPGMDKPVGPAYAQLTGVYGVAGRLELMGARVGMFARRGTRG
ncbi:MAG TPA: hypothetical protein GX513_08675 [Firmicutes bacterium]|nr:hypothetical protein [Bacillota bacterium]